MKEPLIRLTDISMVWDGRAVLDGITLTVNRGDFVAITGPNGGGKTTLLKIILRLLRPTAGSVEYLGDGGLPVDRLPIGYLPQKNMIDARFPITVREVIASGLLSCGKLIGEERRRAVDGMLEVVDLADHAGHAIGSLSGGQLQRVLLGRALVSRPSILVMDEPLSYIDKHFESRLYDLVNELAPRTTILLVSHEMSVIAGMASRHLIVDHTVHECTSHSHFIPSPCN